MDHHEEEKEDVLWCARVAICQYRLECMDGSMDNAKWRFFDLLNSTFIRFSNLASKI